MATTALILHLQRTLGTPTAVGLLLFAQAIPPIGAPFAGAIADRLRPARLLGAGLLTQAALTGILALRLPSLGPLLAIVFLLALVDTPLGAAVVRTPSLLAIAAGFWIVVFFTAPDDLILPFLATTTFRSGPVAVGVLLAAASVGVLVGLPLVGPLGRRLGATVAIVAGFAVMAT